MSTKQYNIDGYLSYNKQDKIIEYDANNDIQFKQSNDKFELSTFFLYFFLYHIFVNIGLNTLIIILFPFLSFVAYPLFLIMNGFGQSLIVSFILTYYKGFIEGMRIRTHDYNLNNIPYLPTIITVITWDNEYLCTIPYYMITPDIYNILPEMTYQFYNEVENFNFATLIKLSNILYGYLYLFANELFKKLQDYI
jgi:hypothetical protein